MAKSDSKCFHLGDGLYGCEDFPIVEQPVANLTVGLVTGLGGVTDSVNATPQPSEAWTAWLV